MYLMQYNNEGIEYCEINLLIIINCPSTNITIIHFKNKHTIIYTNIVFKTIDQTRVFIVFTIISNIQIYNGNFNMFQKYSNHLF